MTIHDILCNCGSVHAETAIFILEAGTIKRVCQFKDLEPRYGMLPIKFFTISPLYMDTNLLVFKFYV